MLLTSGGQIKVKKLIIQIIQHQNTSKLRKSRINKSLVWINKNIYILNEKDKLWSKSSEPGASFANKIQSFNSQNSKNKDNRKIDGGSGLKIFQFK